MGYDVEFQALQEAIADTNARMSEGFVLLTEAIRETSVDNKEAIVSSLESLQESVGDVKECVKDQGDGDFARMVQEGIAELARSTDEKSPDNRELVLVMERLTDQFRDFYENFRGLAPWKNV